MRAVTVVPLKAGSVDLTDRPEPPDSDGPVLVKTRDVGVCGTDLEIVAGEYGWAPEGEERLAIGHESVGQVPQRPVHRVGHQAAPRLRPGAVPDHPRLRRQGGLLPRGPGRAAGAHH